MVRDENLDFWIKHGYNVLFVGAHGVGKTSIVRDAFNRNGLSWKYFSAATMDPWVDLVGVPRERQSEDGEPFLDLVRCQGLDEVEALFFDELNRAHKKVRNAVMELIQFRTINGKPFKKLKAIWAAINPDDDETYDVEKLDPAQADRFHVKVTIPYKPERDYFAARYGQHMASSAISWWHELPEDMKSQVSPRRLDYALDIHRNSGDIRYALPEQCNVAKLLTTLKHGPIQEALQKFLAESNTASAKEFLASDNNFNAAIGYIKKSRSMMSFFFPLLSPESISVLASEVGPRRFILDNITTCPAYAQCILDIFRTGTDKGAVREIEKTARSSSDVAKVIGRSGVDMAGGAYQINTNPEKPYFSSKPVNNAAYKSNINRLADTVANMYINKQYMQTPHRKRMYDDMLKILPPTLSVDEAVDTLRFINGIASRSQFSTFEKLDHLMGVVNHCFRQIARQTGWSLERIVHTHQAKFPRMWGWICADKELSAKLAAIEGAKA